MSLMLKPQRSAEPCWETCHLGRPGLGYLATPRLGGDDSQSSSSLGSLNALGAPQMLCRLILLMLCVQPPTPLIPWLARQCRGQREGSEGGTWKGSLGFVVAGPRAPGLVPDPSMFHLPAELGAAVPQKRLVCTGPVGLVLGLQASGPGCQPPARWTEKDGGLCVVLFPAGRKEPPLTCAESSQPDSARIL